MHPPPFFVCVGGGGGGGQKPPKNIAVFSEKTDVPYFLKPVHSGKFSHEAVTLKIRTRSPKSNKLLILSNLYGLANLVTFHPMVHEITCRQTLFGLILVDYIWQ